MNIIGKNVKKAQQKLKVEPSYIFVLHDEMEMKLGRYKIAKGLSLW